MHTLSLLLSRRRAKSCRPGARSGGEIALRLPRLSRAAPRRRRHLQSGAARRGGGADAHSLAAAGGLGLRAPRRGAPAAPRPGASASASAQGRLPRRARRVLRGRPPRLSRRALGALARQPPARARAGGHLQARLRRGDPRRPAHRGGHLARLAQGRDAALARRRLLWPRAEIAGAGAHHVLGLAAGILRHLPSDLLYVIAASHSADHGQICSWLDAASIIANGEKTTCPSRQTVEAFIDNFANADSALTSLAWSRYVANAPRGWARYEALAQDGDALLLFSRSP